MLTIGAANVAVGIALNQQLLLIVGLTLVAMSSAVIMLAMGKRQPVNQVQSLLDMKPFYESQRRLEILAVKTPDNAPSKSLVKEALLAGKTIVEQAEELSVAKKKLAVLLFEASEYRVKLQKLKDRSAPAEDIEHVEAQISAYGTVKESSLELDKRISELSREFETLVTQLVNGGAVEATESLNLEDRGVLGELKALAASAEEVKNWISSTSELNYERNQTSS